MTPRPATNYPKEIVVAVRLSKEMVADMKALQTRDGIPQSEQIRRALRVWLKSKGVTSKTQRPRTATTRKRS
jgi:hypothetical protein